jgi:hypothetical protein
VFASQQQPRFFQNRYAAFAPHAARLFAADLVKSQVHLRRNMKTIEDVQRL